MTRPIILLLLNLFCCRGKIFTEPLPSNDMAVHIRVWVYTHRLMEEFVKYSVETVRRLHKPILIFTKQEHYVNKIQFECWNFTGCFNSAFVLPDIVYSPHCVCAFGNCARKTIPNRCRKGNRWQILSDWAENERGGMGRVGLLASSTNLHAIVWPWQVFRLLKRAKQEGYTLF
jgi:hypothetical protein